MSIRVLVLEPEKELLDSYSSFFARMTEFETRVASSSDECLAHLKTFSPHALIMEPALPADDLPEILEAVQNSGESTAKVILLTKFGRHAMRTNDVVDEFYVKPVSMKGIAHTIRDLCSDPSGTAQCEATRNEVWIDSPAVTGQVQTVH